jgi:hypothetical protein
LLLSKIAKIYQPLNHSPHVTQKDVGQRCVESVNGLPPYLISNVLSKPTKEFLGRKLGWNPFRNRVSLKKDNHKDFPSMYRLYC